MKLRERILLVVPFVVLAVIFLYDEERKDVEIATLNLEQEMEEVGIYDSLFMQGMERLPDFTLISTDFMNFYERFNMDTVYQQKHLEFPLKGVCFSSCDSTTLWSKERWRHLKWDFRTLAENPMYDVVMAQSDTKFFFKCEIHDLGILYELGFVKISGSWKLVYCILNAC